MMYIKVFQAVECRKATVNVEISVARHPHTGRQVFEMNTFGQRMYSGNCYGSLLYVGLNRCHHTLMVFRISTIS